MATRVYTPKRFVSSVPSHAAPTDAFTTRSTDWLVDPTEQKAYRRRGQTTLTNSALANSLATPRARHALGIRARQQSVSTAPAFLWTDEGTSPKTGEIVLRDIAGAAFYSLGNEYGTTHYAANGVAAPNFRWIPLWKSASGYARGITATQRGQILAGGGRKMLEQGEWLFVSSFQSPFMWRKTWNISSSTGSNINRLRPWGHYPPMYFPRLQAGGGQAATTNWRLNYAFYYSVSFLMEDGSISPPIVPRDSIATARGDTATLGVSTASGGRCKIVPDGSNNYAQYIRWSNIPCGGPGTVGRVLWRTVQEQVDPTKTGLSLPGALDLRICAVIRDNTTTVFDDYIGDDQSLTVAPDSLHFDMRWPPRCQVVVANDQRILVGGKIQLNPAAFMVAPVGDQADCDLNGTDAVVPTNKFFIRITTDSVYLLRIETGAEVGIRFAYATPAISPGVVVAGKFYRGAYATITNNAAPGTATNWGKLTSAGAVITPLTIQDLVDAININQQTTSPAGVQGGAWAAQVVPGAPGDAYCTNLSDTGTTDFGDNTRSGASDGQAWVRNPAEPFVANFIDSYLSQTVTQEQEIIFTTGNPTSAASAPLNWVFGNERSPANSRVGRFLNAAPMRDKFVVFYEHGIYWLRNTKAGGTGEDQDYRLVPIVVDSVHVVGWNSIFWGEGYCGCMTAEGVMVIDENGWTVISRDIWNRLKQDPSDGTLGIGEWKNEITKSIKATASDTDDSFIHATVMGHQIHLAYRKSASAACDRRMVYDYSINAGVTGIQALLSGTEPLGWSTPLTNSMSAMVELTDATNLTTRYGIVDASSGRVDQFDTGTTDNGSAIPASGFLKADFCDTTKLKRAKQITVVYMKDATGITVTFYRDAGETLSASGTSVGLPSSGALAATPLYGRTVLDLPNEARTPAQIFEMKVVDDGTTGTALPEIWRVELEYDELQSVR